MAKSSDIRNGMCIKLDGKLLQVIEFLHVKPGKGGAFVRTKLKDVESGKILDRTFNTSVKLEEVRIENRSYQFLFKDDLYHFMNNKTFEQVGIQAHLINEPDLLKEGENVDILFHDEEEMPLSVELPPFVELKITYTEPGLRGDTANNATKPAKVETGAEVQVPLFINEGEKIKIDTRTKSYSERVKE